MSVLNDPIVATKWINNALIMNFCSARDLQPSFIVEIGETLGLKKITKLPHSQIMDNEGRNKLANTQILS